MNLRKILFFLVLLSSSISAQEEKQVLFLSSYNSRFPTYFKQIEGLKDGLATPFVDIDVEFLDSKRFNDSLSYELFYSSLANKLKKIDRYDAIVTADDNAFYFSLKHQKDLFKDSPILFLGLNNIEKAYEQNKNPNVTGIAEKVPLKENIDLMKDLFGTQNPFYIITDNTTTGKTITNQLLEITSQYPDITFEVVNFGAIDGLNNFTKTLNNIPSKAPILLISALKDATSKWYDFHNSLQIIYKNTESPIFHLWEHGIEQGIFGGKFVSLFDEGKEVGKLLKDILKGREISNIEVKSNSTHEYIFNYNELVKYGIELDLLPENSIIKNKPIRFLDEHLSFLIGFFILLASLISLISFFLISIRRKEKAEEQLNEQNKVISELNDELQLSNKKIEEELEKFKSIFLNHSIPKLILDSDHGDIFDANIAATKFYGYSMSQLKSMNIKDLDVSNFFDKIKNKNLTGENSFELKHKKADGALCDVEVIVSKIPMQYKKDHIYCIINDISDEKIHEFNSNLFQHIVEQSPVSIVITNVDGYIEYVNPVFQEITGYTFNEAVGKHSRILKSGKQSQPFYKELWDTVLSGKIWTGDLINKRKNGELYHIRKTLCPIVDENNQVKNFLAIGQDTTEITKAYNELLNTKKALEHSNQLKTEFMQNMSHEVRTPMNGILGFSELLGKKELSEEKKQKYISVIQNSGKQLLKIIEDILEISKLATKQVSVYTESFCFNTLLKELQSSFSLPFFEKGIAFELDVEDIDQTFIINSDKVKLNSILNNLLSNALKFTEKGSVTFGYRITNNKIECFVKDTGIGISKSNLTTIFNHFEQEEKDMRLKYDGLGLGLAISKENAKLLKGDIKVKSIKGSGSTFTLEIPLTQVKTNIVQEAAEKNMESKTIKKSQKTFKILLAEDEEVNHWYIDTILENQLDFELLYAANGEIAVELFEEHPDIDLVLMDLKMPVLDGFEATKLIKAKNPNIPIIAVSSFTSPIEKERAFEEGCIDFITKPFEEKKLVEIIYKYLK